LMMEVHHGEHRGHRAFVNDLTQKVIGLAIEVHRALGPGLLESTYEACVAHELSEAKITFHRQKPLKINYKSHQIDCAYRLDFVVEDKLLLELKSVDALDRIHEAQVLTYLKLGNYPLGLLINFNVPVLKDGIKRLRI